MLYRELVTDLYNAGELDQLRLFLKAAGDKSALAVLDRETMGQPRQVVAESPPLRGQQ